MANLYSPGGEGVGLASPFLRKHNKRLELYPARGALRAQTDKRCSCKSNKRLTLRSRYGARFRGGQGLLGLFEAARGR